MNIEKSVLHEDNHLMIINKPANILSQGDQTRDITILDLVKPFIKERDNKPGNVFLQIAHRLDRPVSGVLILCKTSKSLTRMTELFRLQKVTKQYIALSDHVPKMMVGTIENYLLKDKAKNKTRVSSQDIPGAKKAFTSYEYRPESGQFLLWPKTGRSHQLRVHMQMLGCPIMGDLKYGAQHPLPDKSIALHCESIEFVHPVKKTNLRINAPFPPKPWWS